MAIESITPDNASSATIAHNYVHGAQSVTHQQLAQVAQDYLRLRDAIASYASNHQKWAEEADATEYDQERIEDSYLTAYGAVAKLGQ